MTVRRPLVVALTSLLLLVSCVAPVFAATEEPQGADLGLRIERVDLAADGTSRMTLSVSGLPTGESIDLARLELVENGVPVEGVRLASSEQVGTTAVQPAVVVAVDISGSTEGAALAAAQQAAVTLVQSIAADGALVGAVSFGPEVQVIAPLSPSAAAPTSAIQQLRAAGATALFDAVSRSVRLLASHDGPRDVVVFSDGEDTASASSLDDVRSLLADAQVRVTTVVLDTDGVDVAAMQAIADVSGGSLVRVEAASDLSGAFDTIAADLRNRVEIVWDVAAVPAQPTDLNIVATYRTADGAASDGRQVANPRLPEITPAVPVEAPSPPIPALANGSGLVIAVVAAALGVLLLSLLILAAGGNRRRRSGIDARLASYRRTSKQDDAVKPATSLADRAANVFEALPSPTSFDERIAADIEHADWPMRVGEFSLLVLGTTFGAFFVVAILTGSLPVAVLFAVFGAAGPFMALNVAVSRRRAAFAEQLPSVLQVLSGALRAGHAFSTAVEGAVDEVDEPAKSELRRASVENRLGRPMEQALLGVAERMDSIDLRWVVSALAVQRQVGGNLAEVLNNVAGTLRARASIKRTVAALSAEGRLSAWVIGAMPFVLFVMLSIINPEYVGVLFTTPFGRLLLVTGLVLLGVGIVWLRRVVQPRY